MNLPITLKSLHVKTGTETRPEQALIHQLHELSNELGHADQAIAEVIPAARCSLMGARMAVAKLAEDYQTRRVMELIHQSGPVATMMRKMAKAADLLATKKTNRRLALGDNGTPVTECQTAIEEEIALSSPTRYEGKALDLLQLFAPYVDIAYVPQGIDASASAPQAFLSLPPQLNFDLLPSPPSSTETLLDQGLTPESVIYRDNHGQLYLTLVFKDAASRREAKLVIYSGNGAVHLRELVVYDALEGEIYALTYGKDTAALIYSFLQEEEFTKELYKVMSRHGYRTDTIGDLRWKADMWGTRWRAHIRDMPPEIWHFEKTVTQLMPWIGEADTTPYREWWDENRSLCWVFTYKNWEIRGVGDHLPSVVHTYDRRERAATVSETSWPRLFQMITAARASFHREALKLAAEMSESRFGTYFSAGFAEAAIQSMHAQIKEKYRGGTVAP